MKEEIHNFIQIRILRRKKPEVRLETVLRTIENDHVRSQRRAARALERIARLPGMADRQPPKKDPAHGFFLNRIQQRAPSGDDPEALLDYALQAMQAEYTHNQERVTHAREHRDNLQRMVEDAQKQVDYLNAKSEKAWKKGAWDLAGQLLREKEAYDATLASTRSSLEQALLLVQAAELVAQRQEVRLQHEAESAAGLRMEKPAE